MILKVWEGSEDFVDRYTVRIKNDYYGMSCNPLSPQGFNQYIGSYPNIYEAYLGKEISLPFLPEEVRKAVAERS